LRINNSWPNTGEFFFVYIFDHSKYSISKIKF